jgi:lysophospholipid acyltransferase (LPLAT)-like uncharacterized protein
MSVLKRLVGSRPFQKAVGLMAAEYLRLVWVSTRFVIEPPGIYARALAEAPLILGMWHGQHFLLPFIRGPGPAKVLISRHRDGSVNAIAAERLGIGTIRGSGAHGREFIRKGALGAFREMVDALAQGSSMALTADVPKISRVAGLGIVRLAAISGRPIYLVALATRNRITLKSWDRSVINLPFGRGAIVARGPYWVPPDADASALEATRRTVEADLHAATERAYEVADGPDWKTSTGQIVSFGRFR